MVTDRKRLPDNVRKFLIAFLAIQIIWAAVNIAAYFIFK